MIHGIYVKSRPKNKWHLFSIAISPEAANCEVDEAKRQSIIDGIENPQVAIQVFDSAFWIPEYIEDIKDQKPLFN